MEKVAYSVLKFAMVNPHVDSLKLAGYSNIDMPTFVYSDDY